MFPPLAASAVVVPATPVPKIRVLKDQAVVPPKLPVPVRVNIPPVRFMVPLPVALPPETFIFWVPSKEPAVTVRFPDTSTVAFGVQSPPAPLNARLLKADVPERFPLNVLPVDVAPNVTVPALWVKIPEFE